MIEDGGALPDSSPLEAVMVDRENRDGVGILMPLKTEAIKAVGVNVTIPEDVLDRIDRYAADHGFNRSGCLTLAAKMAMETMEEMPDARNEPIAAPHRNTPGGHG